jgi:hypothetical protein
MRAKEFVTLNLQPEQEYLPKNPLTDSLDAKINASVSKRIGMNHNTHPSIHPYVLPTPFFCQTFVGNPLQVVILLQRLHQLRVGSKQRRQQIFFDR